MLKCYIFALIDSYLVIKRLFVILSLLLFLLTGNNGVNAQTWQVGGDVTALYIDAYKYQMTILGGYEFNDSIAIQASAGITGIDDYKDFLTGAYFRYTPWHNDVLFLDLRFRAQFLTDLYAIEGADIGVTPMLRFRFSSHWDFYAAIGTFGA